MLFILFDDKINLKIFREKSISDKKRCIKMAELLFPSQKKHEGIKYLLS